MATYATWGGQTVMIQPKQVLRLKAPLDLENSVAIFTAFFEDLHKLAKTRLNPHQPTDTISCEVWLQENYFSFQIVAPQPLAAVITPLIYTKFNRVEITQAAVEIKVHGQKQVFTEFTLERSSFFPLKTSFTSQSDPYLMLAAVLNKLEHYEEGVCLQILLKPTSESWSRQFLREKFSFIIGALNNLNRFLHHPFLEKEAINYYQVVKQKFDSKLFYANLRVAISAPSTTEVNENLGLVSKALDKLSLSDINALVVSPSQPEAIKQRFMARSLSPNPFILNSRELAAIFHFPDSSLHITNLEHVAANYLPPPQNLPKGQFLDQPHHSIFGKTLYRETSLEFGLDRRDRNRHAYIVGKTGMGKSKLIELLILSDIFFDKGFCVIDPHGDLAENILSHIPPKRVNDVIYFNPSDTTHPLGFNPLTCETPEAKYQVVTGFIAIFKKLFGAQWNSRLEHVLRFIVLALVEVGNTTVIDIVRLLTETDYRHQLIAQLEDPVVKNFWTHEFTAWNEKFDNEAIIPLINQVGQFISNDYIRHVVSQPQSAFDFSTAMNEAKIIVINIAKGKLGEENTALLGSMILTKIQEATMARVNQPEDQRPEFYLYVDEFQHFATDSFNQLLSEARKFNLAITIAHQYLDQLTPAIRKTVFGNVGSFITFRTGPEDAAFLAKEFTPGVNQADLINLNIREVYAKLSVVGKTTEPFSATTLTVKPSAKNLAAQIKTLSRQRYGKSPAEIAQYLQQAGPVVDLISSQRLPKPPSKPTFEEPIV
ncbi:hypothetical protein A2W24_00335 [Microgenomates group bacterium RBG_16_45_19]|nr:MAG: hypothetical protein A2W24_00335 [Microgenomates group bacterium RBG_16_45_19]